MSDVQVSGLSSDKAVLLLAAVETLKLDPRVVRTTSDGFVVPEEVATEAFGKKAAKAETAPLETEQIDKKASKTTTSKSAKAEGTKE